MGQERTPMHHIVQNQDLVNIKRPCSALGITELSCLLIYG
jgi:hypothetical protein